MTERYAGPSAARTADPMPRGASSDQGWFWTTTAIRHGGRIDARCRTRGCSRGLVATHLEALLGLPV